ncbi:MAG: dihydrodipicolinate synthase family protein [Bryobacteraceae bacterium]|nr:dihydrodipicolinate synthase family protein [Bryobacteraceae bacterium]MDW8379724.1 dihydrodipicolinate synthase family protein [Bryobacterales bacterium]
MPPFDGVFAAAVTPSRADAFQLDPGAALEVIDFLNAHGVRGIALFGATGEFLHFPAEERIRLAHLAIQRSQVPVLVNATHSCFEEAQKIAREAEASGAAGILLMPPYFFRYSAEDIREFLLCLRQQIRDDTRLLLYNLPAYNNEIPLEVAFELIAEGVVDGIKDSSGDWDYLTQLLAKRRKRDFALLLGNDNLFVRGFAAGADGAISGCACALPELMTALQQAVQQSREAVVRRLTARLGEFIRWIETFPGPYGIREAMAERGLTMGKRSVPLAPSTEQRLAEFRQWFREWLPGVIKESQQPLPETQLAG